MVTPFDEDGSLNLDKARTLAKWLQDHGNEGLVIAGTTGESPVLSDDERLSLFAAVREVVTIPLVAGTTTSDTAHSVHLTKEAAALGVDAILAVCPYYSRPSQAGIVGHIEAVAASTDLPVIVYDIPVRTGRKISTANLLKLARDVPSVVALKDAAGNPGETAALISSAPDGFEVYSGDDVMTLPLLGSGAVGVIGVATHWTADDHQLMFDLWGKGDLVGARLVNSRMLESFAYETGDDAPNPLPSKVMMNLLGVPVGEARLPMGPPPAWLEPRAREVHANLETWRAAWPHRPS